MLYVPVKIKVEVAEEGCKPMEQEFTTFEGACNFLRQFERSTIKDPSLEGEIWKDIPGYQDYQASNFGRIRSLKGGAVLVLAQRDRLGYLTVGMGGKKHITVHRLVAYAFHPNPDNLPQVNHKNFNRHDNRPENLEWCTQEYNNEYNKQHRHEMRLGKEAEKSPEQRELDRQKRSAISKEAWAKRRATSVPKYEVTHIKTGKKYYFVSLGEAVKELGGQQPDYWAVLKGRVKQHKGYTVKLITY